MRLPMVKLVLVVALVALLGAGMVSTVNIGGVGTVSAQQAELGTKDHPIYLLLVPSVEAPVIQASGDAIAQALYDHTRLYVEAHMTADYAALIEAMRTAEGDTFAIPTTAQYVEIYDQTDGGVDVALASVRRGYTYYFASFYAPREKGFKSLEDLNGKIWCYPDPGSTSGYKLPKIVMEEHGIQAGGTVETGSHVNSMVALIQGQCDFATGYGSPPDAPQWMKDQGVRWEWGDDPELMIWDRWNNKLFREGLRWEGVDLRHAVEDEYPDVWEKIGVVGVAGPLANDCIAFAKGFPGEKLHTIADALQWHIHTPEGAAVWGDPKFYEWSDMAPITDDYYNLVRKLLGYPVPKPYIRLEIMGQDVTMPVTKVAAESSEWHEVVPLPDWSTIFGLSLIGDNDEDGNLSTGDLVALTKTEGGESADYEVIDLYPDAEGRVNINITLAGE